MRHAFKIVAAVGAASLLFAGCSKPADSRRSTASAGSSSPSAAAGSLKACMVLDVGGVDDHSFNQSSWGGLQAANKANPNIKISYVPSSSQNDYTPNLTAETNKGCDTVIAVGGLMTDAVTKIAKKNPNQQYAQIDSSSSGPNVYGLQYNTAQGGFLGGYLAAGMSKTGKVATYGGLNIPPVTIYMDGFYEGVQYYNQKNGKNVQVLGWNEKNQKGGTFANSFTDANKGKPITQQFQQQGADIVFPVAGGTGVGSAAAAPGVQRPALRDLGRHRRLRERPAVLQVLPDLGDQEPHRLGPASTPRRLPPAPSRAATTSARWRTTAPASRRSTTSTARSPRT